METVECPRCKKPIADRRRGVVASRQPFEFDQATGALVVICAHYWMGGKCRERTVVSVTRVVAVEVGGQISAETLGRQAQFR